VAIIQQLINQELFKSTNRGGTNLYTQQLSPLKGDYSAVIVFSHGYAEYCNRYFDFAAEHKVLGLGVMCCHIDHFAHGFSDGMPAMIDDMNLVVDDLLQYAQHCKKQYVKDPKKTKFFLFANSMGGMIGLQTVRKAPEDLFDGLILEGPLIVPTNPPNQIVIWAAHFLNLFASQMALVAALSQLNTDPEVEKQRLADPLMYLDKMRVGTGVQMQTCFLDLQEHLDEIKLPWLCVHGELDTACAIAGVEALKQKSPSKDKTLTIYKQQHHELLWEPDKDKIIAEIKQWLKQRM